MTKLEVDVCVIGAGAAGLVIAELLTRDAPVRVCIVEAGPRNFANRCEPFQVRSTRKLFYGVNEALVTAFGGATNTWGGGLIRPSAADLLALDGQPDTGWPFTLDELTPHLEAIESLFGFVPRPDQVMFEADGLVVRRRDIPILLFRRKNFGRLFGPSLVARDHVKLLCDAEIIGVRGEPGSGVRALEITQPDSGSTTIHARRYILSAGVIGTNLLAERFLRDLGIEDGAAEHGRYFHGHASFSIARLRPKSQGAFSRRFGYRFERGIMLGEHFDIETTDRVAPGAFLHLAVDMSTSSMLRPVREILNAIQRRTIEPGAITMADLYGLLKGGPRLGLTRYLNRRLYLDEGATILATLMLEQVPSRQWRLVPTAEGCDLDWGLSDEDVDYAARYLPACRAIMDRLQDEAAFDVEPIAPDPEREPAAFRAFLEEHSVGYHASGGLRMSDAPDGVVDRDLRLRHAPNVHLVSTAVFPRVGTSNPTHALLALGRRLVLQIRDELQLTSTPGPSVG